MSGFEVNDIQLSTRCFNMGGGFIYSCGIHTVFDLRNSVYFLVIAGDEDDIVCRNRCGTPAPQDVNLFSSGEEISLDG